MAEKSGSSRGTLDDNTKQVLDDQVDRLRQLQSGVSGNRAKVLEEVCVALAGLTGSDLPPVPVDSSVQSRAEREAAKTAAREATSDNSPEVSTKNA